MRSIGLQELIIIAVVMVIWVATAVPFVKISQRMGFSAVWGLLTLIPFGILLWGYYVAFAKWPTNSSPR